MKRIIMLAAAGAFALAGCGGDSPVDNGSNAADAAAVDNIVVNDLTAIDAVTGEDANMAEDVEFNASEFDNEAGNASANGDGNSD